MGSLDLAYQYVEDVLSGEILVCKSVRQMIERHVRDLDNEETEAFPYYFDEDAAAAAIEFFPLALRHSIGIHEGKPLELEPWQCFCIASIFGWRHMETNCRRFRRVYWSMGRKNGKSTIAAGIAILMVMLDVNPYTNDVEKRAQVILAATKKEQAVKVVYAECLKMRVQSPMILEGSEEKYQHLRFAHNDGTIECVGSDRPFDGLNPSLVVMDETHAWGKTHQGFYSTMVTGSGSRAQPLTMTVTTAGDDRSHIWLEEVGFAKQVLNQTVDEETVFVACYEIDEEDDPLDESMWIKANPNLGVSVQLDYLKQQATRAEADVVALNRFKRYHANVLVSSTERIFDIDDFRACSGLLSDWSSRECDACGMGVDLGGRDDLASYAVVARFPIGEEEGKPLYRFECRTQSYIASNTKRDLREKPFCDWIDEGRLKVTATPIADLMRDAIDDYWRYNVADIAIDPYNSQQFGEESEIQGVRIATMAQTTAHFNAPIGIFRQAIANRNFRHDDDVILQWCLSNAVAVRDRADRWMLDKASSSQKIDPCVAMLMALSRAIQAPQRAVGDLYIV